jgi:hypothetical protein
MNRRKMVFAMAFALAAAPGIAIGASKAENQAEVRKAAQGALAAALGSPRRVKPSRPRRLRRLQQLRHEVLVAGGGSGEGHGPTTRPGNNLYEDGRGGPASFRPRSFRWSGVRGEAALNNFVNSGWEFGGQATAAARPAMFAYRGAVSSTGGLIYQVTDGLALEPPPRHQVLQGRRIE